MPVAEVAAALEKSFGDWHSAVAPLPERARPSATFAEDRRVVFVPKPGASQSVILVASPAPGGEEPRHAEAFAVSRLLGDDFISRINAVIREAKGYSYGTSGEVMDSIDRQSFMAIAAPVEREHTGDALADMLAGYATLVSAPVRPDEVNRTITDMLTTIAGTAETASALVEAVRDQMGIGSTLEAAHTLRLAVVALDVEAVRTEAVGLADLDTSLIVVVGDPETVLPQLEAMGMTPETIDPGSI
jgi:predicted Zn-dependent peptidase